MVWRGVLQSLEGCLTIGCCVRSVADALLQQLLWQVRVDLLLLANIKNFDAVMSIDVDVTKHSYGIAIAVVERRESPNLEPWLRRSPQLFSISTCLLSCLSTYFLL